MGKADRCAALAEVQGLYGPLQLAEGRIQRAWALQELSRGEWRTRSGKRLSVVYPGHWNRGAGPDFLGSEWELDGVRQVGDVEIHLNREDWIRHGHHLDAAYNGVGLHVVFFAGGSLLPVATQNARIPEEWVLGPWMREDLEAVAGGPPGLFGEWVPELAEWLEADSPEAVRERLLVGADRRWQQKESLAVRMLQDHGWEGSLHRMLLYYLGYPVNCRAFFQIAEAFPLEDWLNPGLPSRLRRQWASAVQWGCGRPANRAGPRLESYGQLVRTASRWPGQARCPAEALKECLQQSLARHGAGDTRRLRHAARFSDWRVWTCQTVFAGTLCQGLGDRLRADVLLPFLAADRQLPPEAARALWFHGWPGAFPDACRRLLRLAGIGATPRYPLCNGWLQGLLWADDQLRLERLRRSLGSGGGGGA